MTTFRVPIWAGFTVLLAGCPVLPDDSNRLDGAPSAVGGRGGTSGPGGRGGETGVGGAGGSPSRPEDAGADAAASCQRESPRAEGAGCSPMLCEGLEACCAVAGTCCEPSSARVVARIESAGCAAGGSGCLLGLIPFGTMPPGLPAPDGARPGGNADSDGGWVTSEPLDSDTELSLNAKMAVPDPGACGPGPCAEVIAMGLLAQPPAKDGSRLAPLVSLAISASRGQRLLQAGGVTIWEAPLDREPRAYRLVLRPDGEVRLLVEGKPVYARRLTTPRPRQLWAVFYGRNGAVEAPTRARLDQASVVVTPCGEYQSWSAVRFPFRDLVGLDPHGPSIAAGADGRVGLAFESRGAIHLRFLNGLPAEGAGPPPEVLIGPRPGQVDQNGALDPDLWWDADRGRWVLHYLGLDARLARSLLRAELSPAGELLAAAVPVATPEAFDGDIAGPDVVELSPGGVRMVLRRQSATGEQLVLATLSAGRKVTVVPLASRSAAPTAFDFSGLGTGAMVRVENTNQLFFEGIARGLSSIGLQASDNLGYWTDKRTLFASAAPVAARSGYSDPDAAVIGDRLVLVFVASDLDGSNIALVDRPVTP